MGQILEIYASSRVSSRRSSSGVLRNATYDRRARRRFHPSQKSAPSRKSLKSFVDLKMLPTELALNILSNLDATDLCLASCVWYDLGCDDLLWLRLCHQTWPFCSAYKSDCTTKITYRQLYLRLDEARLTFNADAFEGFEYLKKYGLLVDSDEDIVAFFHTAPGLDPVQKRRFLQSRPAILDQLLALKDFKRHFLPNALRRLFNELPAPTAGTAALEFVSSLVSKFSRRFVECNPDMGLTEDEVYMLCFSLIMLSVDLWSPHVKNKMSKREFIRNTRLVARSVADDYLGHLYDNVYVVGHVVLGDVAGPPTPQPDIRTILA
ncbi:unnamed protein product [Calicophoron daubneyi]|uniref:SEC7 domain-containing protein n=1 Tax=Calicophoron daubneyi TaxID=300641 RepID=A0AAV2SYR3_CALDB